MEVGNEASHFLTSLCIQTAPILKQNCQSLIQDQLINIYLCQKPLKNLKGQEERIS